MLHFHQFLLSCWLVLAIVAAVEESKPESVSTDLAAEESRHYGGYGVRRNGGYGGGGHRYGGYRGRRSIIDDAIQVFISLHLLHPASTSRLTPFLFSYHQWWRIKKPRSIAITDMVDTAVTVATVATEGIVTVDMAIIMARPN